MAKISFVPANKVETAETFPRLKLKVGEIARVIYLETPEFEYTHTLRSPEIDDDGKPVMKWVEPKKGGDPIEVNALEWVGRSICLGDPEKIKQRGVDVDNCPICAKASKSQHFPKPERRFAMHVAQYATKPGSAELQNPFSAQIKVWAFTENIFNQLSDFIYQDGWDPLTNYDLKLGPCEAPEMFQKFKINVLKVGEWLGSTERETYIRDLFASNQAKDLSTFCGFKSDHKRMQDDIDVVEEKWAIVNGEKLANKDEDAKKSNLHNLLGGGGKKAAPVEEPPSPKVPEGVGVSVDSTPVAPVAAPESEPVKAPDNKPAVSDVGKENIPEPVTENFQDLLAGL